MRKIDYEKTVEQGVIVYSNQYYNTVETIVFICFYALFLGFIEYLFASTLNWENTPANRFGILALVLFNILLVFFFYKKTKQRKVIRIQTELSKVENRDFVERLIQETRSWDNVDCNENYLTGEHSRSFSDKPPVLTVVFCENYIMLNALGYYFRGFRAPWLRSLNALEKFFIDSSQLYKNKMR